MNLTLLLDFTTALQHLQIRSKNYIGEKIILIEVCVHFQFDRWISELNKPRML